MSKRELLKQYQEIFVKVFGEDKADQLFTDINCERNRAWVDYAIDIFCTEPEFVNLGVRVKTEKELFTQADRLELEMVALNNEYKFNDVEFMLVRKFLYLMEGYLDIPKGNFKFSFEGKRCMKFECNHSSYHFKK